MRKLALFLAFALSAFSQRHKLEEVNSALPEGSLLQQVLREDDASRKVALMEQFAQQFPKAQSTPWVLEQLQAAYAKANDPDKTIATGEKLLALDPGDPGAPLECLKASEARKDYPGIRKWSDMASANARRAAAASQPSDPQQAASWKDAVDYARQVDTYADYALYRAALEAADPKLIIDLSEDLRARSPQSDYAGKVAQPLFAAYRRANANDKALGLAEQSAAAGQADEDMLLVVADRYLQEKREPEKVHAYSAKIIEIMNAKPKPEGVADADWAARKALVMGLAYYMDGKLYYSQDQFAPADRELRQALSLVETNAALKPEVLFLLAHSNYKLASVKAPERAQDAANYFRQCAAIKSPYQTTAAANLKRIQSEYHGVK